MDLFQFFEPNCLLFLVCGLCLLTLSIGFFEVRTKTRVSLLLLFLSALCTYSFSANLDPFLNTWDEQFHALVAKNFLLHPFIPTLYENHIISYDPLNWTANYIWLHKQPLFLWQIALSLKLFGINELSVRIPSILMMSILPLFIARIGKISLNERIGYYGAILCCTSFFIHELVSGFPACEHNDTAFLFYVTASIWAWVEYQNSQNKYWLILIGLFSGCAVLIKWLTGLLIFSGWGLSVIMDKEKRTSFKCYYNILISLIVCLLVFLPWQLHILNSFPVESHIEYAKNSEHFTTVVEDHGGSLSYYWDNVRDVYFNNDLAPIIILISFFFFYKKLKTLAFKIAFFTFIIFVYTFFTIAATKMIAFCFIVSPLIFLSLASMIDALFSFIDKNLFKNGILYKGLSIFLLCLLAFGNLDLHMIAYKHTMFIRPNDNDKRIDKINNVVFIKSLKNSLTSDDFVIFNCKPQCNISIMFYTKFTAYDKPLDYDNYILLKNKKTKLAVIDNGELSDFIQKDSSIIKIKGSSKN